MSRKKSQITAVTQQFNRLAIDADLYRQNLIEYIKDHVKSKEDFDVIQHLLEAYEQLANCYYDQFRQSLVTKLQLLDEDRVALETAVTSRQKQTVVATLNKASEAAKLEYDQLINKIPILLQQALSKLAAEWERVYQVVVASRAARSEMKLFMDALTPVVRAAACSVGIDASNLSVIPQIGSEFALQFFNYADNFMVLSMPIFAFNAPWEWSIIWHEMAGYLVRQLKESEFETVNQRLAQQAPYKQAFVRAGQRLHQLTQADPDTLNLVEKELAQHADVIINNMITLAAAGLGQPAPELNDYINQGIDYQTNDRILDFHTQLQAIRDKILRERGPDAYEDFLAFGWGEDWLEELFEDAFSSRFFRRPFLATFSRILNRFDDGGKGLRHPPRKTRLLVAQKIIELTSSDEPEETPAAAMGMTAAHPVTNGTESKVNFIADVTIEDETEIEASQPFVKTWRVQNVGTRTWGEGYRLKFIQGTPLTSTLEHPLPVVKPGELVNISISLTTPDEPGRYFGDWRFMDDQGNFFGALVYFVINVKRMPLQEYIISLVAKRIHHTLSLLARQTNQAQLDALQKYTKLINESVSTPVRIHTVQPGDNLYRIGRLYGIPWQELAHRNNLSDPDKIVAGQRLYVSEPLSLQEDLESVQMLWQERPFIPQPGFSSAKAQAQIVGTIIREAMKRWLEGDANAAKEAIKQLSDFSKAPVAMSVDADEPGENTVESDSFIELIKAMDHTELMGLTFTDVDYAQTNFVTITRGLQNYKVLAQTWLTWQTGTPKRVRAVSTTDTLTADQVVVIKASQEWRMSSDWWSSARNGVPKLIRDA